MLRNRACVLPSLYFTCVREGLLEFLVERRHGRRVAAAAGHEGRAVVLLVVLLVGEVASATAATANAVVSVDPERTAAADAIVSVDPERAAAAASSAVSVVVAAAARDVSAVSVFAVPHERLVVSEAENWKDSRKN